MRLAIGAILLVIVALQMLRFEEPSDLPPVERSVPAADADEIPPAHDALSHEIRTSLHNAPSHPPATQPAAKRPG